MSVSEAYEQNLSQNSQRIEGNWFDTVEGIMNAPPGLPHDPDRRLFDRVMAEVGQYDFAGAAAGLKLFLELYPTSPLSAHADYWLGECEFQLGHYREAIQAFDHVPARALLNPQLAAASFLRKGSSYAKLGEIHRSRSLLELLVVQFPTSAEAAAARQTLLMPRPPAASFNQSHSHLRANEN
jgi:TolA-binding protein